MQIGNEIKQKILNGLQEMYPFNLLYYYICNGEIKEALVLYDYLYDVLTYQLTESDMEDITKGIKELMEDE